MGASNDSAKPVAGNAIKTLSIVGWATTARGQPVSLRLTRQDPPPVVPVRAWRGEVLPKGPPARPPSQLPPPATNELSVTVAEPLGIGRCGSVFAVDTLRLTDPNDRKVRFLYPQAPHLPELVIKVADADHEDALRHEAAMYDEMESLQGISIARAYGMFSADIPANTVIPSLPSARRVSILLLERLGDLLPLGDKVPEEGDLWDVFRDLARLGIEHTDIRYSDILQAPNPEYGLPGIPCPYHRCVHAYRIIDFGNARKTDLTLKRHYFNTAGYLGPILENLKSNVILEPWEIKDFSALPASIMSSASTHSITSSVAQQSPSPPPSVPAAVAAAPAHAPGRHQSLDLSAPSIHAIANARIYHTQLSAKKIGGANGSGHEEWTYSRLKGTLKFGQNWANASTVDPYTKKQGNTGSQYYFALADDMTGKTIWMFQIPTTFLYEVDRPFFHVFNGRTRKYGFLFEDDDEAALFSRKVINETCRDSAVKRGRSAKPRGSPFRSRSLTASMISSPAPNSFRHVSHIGVSKGGAFEVSRTLDSAFKEGLVKLQNGLGNKIVVCESSEFLASFWRDVDSRSQSFDEGSPSVASQHHVPFTAASVAAAF